MDIQILLNSIHWLPVIVLTVFSFLLGNLWHSPLMFGKIWKADNHYDVPKDQLNLPLLFGGTAVLHFMALAALNAVCVERGAWGGFLIGFLVSIVWVFTAMGATYLFANRPVRLLLIDAGMYVTLFAVAGLIFGIW